MNWLELPDPLEAREKILAFAEAKTQLKIAQLELQRVQERIKKERPRDTASRIIGYDETSSRELEQLFDAEINAQRNYNILEAECKFLDYWKDMARTATYQQR